jgi:hypothetical protein
MSDKVALIARITVRPEAAEKADAALRGLLTPLQAKHLSL